MSHNNRRIGSFTIKGTGQTIRTFNLHAAFVEWTSRILLFTDFLLVAHSAKFKMKYLNVKYRSWSCQDSQKLQNNASSHYPATIFALCIYFLQYETPLFRIYAFRTRRLIHTSWLQNLNFKLGALRQEKRRGLAFYTGTSCLKTISRTGEF